MGVCERVGAANTFSQGKEKKCTVAFSTSIGGLVYGYLKVDMG
jgi:hypothetical protein